MGRWCLLVAGCLVLSALAVAEESFPPPPMPHAPKDFNIHCDVCKTLTRRVVPYCERSDQNLDYLPDFCTFNYNKVLRTECDFLVDVMDYAWCPNACAEVRRLQAFAGDKICHHPLVNCTERYSIPSPSVSPSPSPSPAVPPDCVLCQYVLKHVASMCMNQEQINSRNVYHVCMDLTKTKIEFSHCSGFLDELVAIAGTQDPCELLSCADPRVACELIHGQCHVVPFEGNTTDLSVQWSQFGMDKSGNLITPEESPDKMAGLGPGDFKPGQSPFHSTAPHRRRAPPHVRFPGHLLEPRSPAEKHEAEEVQEKLDEEAKSGIKEPEDQGSLLNQVNL